MAGFVLEGEPRAKLPSSLLISSRIQPRAHWSIWDHPLDQHHELCTLPWCQLINDTINKQSTDNTPKHLLSPSKNKARSSFQAKKKINLSPVLKGIRQAWHHVKEFSITSRRFNPFLWLLQVSGGAQPGPGGVSGVVSEPPSPRPVPNPLSWHSRLVSIETGGEHTGAKILFTELKERAAQAVI